MQDLSGMDCHELIEAFIDQHIYVSVWRYDNAENTYYKYTRTRLPEGFRGPFDSHAFRTLTPINDKGNYQEIQILGTIEEEFTTSTLSQVVDQIARLLLMKDRPS